MAIFELRKEKRTRVQLRHVEKGKREGKVEKKPSAILT